MNQLHPCQEAIDAWRSVVGKMTDAERKALPIGDALLYFPLAFMAFAEVCKIANEQHNPGQSMHWARGKSKDQLNTNIRHIFDDALGLEKDPADGCWMLAKSLFRVGAALEIKMEAAAARDEKVFTGRVIDKPMTVTEVPESKLGQMSPCRIGGVPQPWQPIAGCLCNACEAAQPFPLNKD